MEGERGKKRTKTTLVIEKYLIDFNITSNIALHQTQWKNKIYVAKPKLLDTHGLHNDVKELSLTC